MLLACLKERIVFIACIAISALLSAPIAAGALSQEGLLPSGLDSGKACFYAVKHKNPSHWGSLEGGFERTGMYAGTSAGQSYILEATGVPGIPPVLQTVDQFLARMDGTVDEIVWACSQANLAGFDPMAVARWLALSSLSSPVADEEQAAALFSDVNALQGKIAYYFEAADYLESGQAVAFFNSFGIKDPIAQQTPLTSLYNAQLAYLFTKYGTGVDPLAGAPFFVADYLGRVVTPLELLLGPQTRIVYTKHYNDVGLPTVTASANTDGSLYITWKLPPSSATADGYAGVIEQISTGKAVIFTVGKGIKSLTLSGMPQGGYLVRVAAYGNMAPLLYPQQHAPVGVTIANLTEQVAPSITEFVAPSEVCAGEPFDIKVAYTDPNGPKDVTTVVVTTSIGYYKPYATDGSGSFKAEGVNETFFFPLQYSNSFQWISVYVEDSKSNMSKTAKQNISVIACVPGAGLSRTTEHW